MTCSRLSKQLGACACPRPRSTSASAAEKFRATASVARSVFARLILSTTSSAGAANRPRRHARMPVARRKDRANEWWVTIHWRGRRVRRLSPVQTKRGAVEFERQLRTEYLKDEAHGVDPLAGPPPTLDEFA